MDPIHFLEENWSRIRTAPFLFSTIAFMAFGFGCFITQKWNDREISHLKARIDDQAERLGVIPAGPNPFTKLTHKELQARALKLVKELRYIVEQDRLKSLKAIEPGTQLNPGPPNDAEQHKRWAEQTSKSMAQGAQFIAEYDSKFKVDAKLLREEILSRFPPEQRNVNTPPGYDHSVNAFMVSSVADDLEQLATQLK